jgi:SAM-dependent methyltransferase
MSGTSGTKLVGKIHKRVVHGRRVSVLARMLAERLLPSQRVLDIGCGDGTISALVKEYVPGIEIQGLEVLVRPDCKIPCQPFDGLSLPFADCTFDVCLFVDVLHHSLEIPTLLREAARVGRSFVLVKDHLSETWLDRITLQFMDWVGNRPHGVALPYNYQSRKQWLAHFHACGLAELTCETRVPLYAPPMSLLFGRKLHFISLLRKQ